MVDGALGRLAGSSLLTFSVDGGSVSAHRLVMRVVRERIARQGRLARVCQAAAGVLDARTGSLAETWSDHRSAVRDLVEQIMALYKYSASCPGEAGSELTRSLLRLRMWAFWFLNDLGDSAAQAVLVAEPLLADQEQILGPDHPDTLASRDNLAIAYRAGQPERVSVHNFADEELGKAVPYGIYDLTANTGWVNVGTDHDTGAFAVASIRSWWEAIGQAAPAAMPPATPGAAPAVPAQVQALLGHASIDTAARYFRAGPAENAEVIERVFGD